MNLIDPITLLLFVVGVFFFTVGTIGLIRMPDVYTRMHATTKSDTLGAVSILLALALYSGNFFTALKMGAIIIFIFMANPTAAHAIAKGAYLSGQKPIGQTSEVDYRETRP